MNKDYNYYRQQAERHVKGPGSSEREQKLFTDLKLEKEYKAFHDLQLEAILMGNQFGGLKPCYDLLFDEKGNRRKGATSFLWNLKGFAFKNPERGKHLAAKVLAPLVIFVILVSIAAMFLPVQSLAFVVAAILSYVPSMTLANMFYNVSRNRSNRKKKQSESMAMRRFEFFKQMNLKGIPEKELTFKKINQAALAYQEAYKSVKHFERKAGDFVRRDPETLKRYAKVQMVKAFPQTHARFFAKMDHVENTYRKAIDAFALKFQEEDAIKMEAERKRNRELQRKRQRQQETQGYQAQGRPQNQRQPAYYDDEMQNPFQPITPAVNVDGTPMIPGTFVDVSGAAFGTSNDPFNQ